MAKDCDCRSPEPENELLALLQASLNSFDHEAAQLATSDQSRDMLKVLKHYIRAIKGGDAVNSDLKNFLNCCAIQPEIPGSVAGGFKFAVSVLQATHKCKGKDCVAKYKEKSRKVTQKKNKVVTHTMVDRDYKKSVKQPGVRVKGTGEKKKRKSANCESSCTFNGNKKDLPSYFI